MAMKNNRNDHSRAFYISHIDFSPHVILILNTEQTSEGLELGMMYSHVHVHDCTMCITEL